MTGVRTLFPRRDIRRKLTRIYYQSALYVTLLIRRIRGVELFHMILNAIERQLEGDTSYTC
ncbi:hypothetical protein GLOTRDRAFT_101803 [Gloeophyllum trabeum ATCC 11539]|uniref:Uncharacterized protein n=1 Tax=Gloeophyllum trabeum (strain ATCC 11539 / FP-39264 / Madison 617) TaxID=670483 RepID=S7RD15_GLOTA|nr:uncharacterized protein GLOTRDRAFT_101803 [Gloeophyllum trabeum ATCC 11539]EPQ50319.1 hypothetical protein GLOTRDRAFT_101803 [Gloeophyllum trabeum ATCC 11539]